MFDVNAVAFKIFLSTTKNQCYQENLIILCLAVFSYWSLSIFEESNHSPQMINRIP